MGARIKLPRAEPLIIDGERISITMLYGHNAEHRARVAQEIKRHFEGGIRATDRYRRFPVVHEHLSSHGQGKGGPIRSSGGAPALVQNDSKNGGDRDA